MFIEFLLFPRDFAQSFFFVVVQSDILFKYINLIFTFNG